ncbi:MAG: thiosulfate oxidation carrier complex protein SoxZ [Betaproteobacteria bacterium]|nr:thiosulfate oxidation carrier complex protein SoxZ [Betaproteobacteria bacterium]
MSNYRLAVPDRVARETPFLVRLIIQHPMETGFRLDAAGAAIPKNLINEIVCRLDGAQVLRMELSSGITANPLFEFFAVADKSGELVVEWQDDGGVHASARAIVQVAD